MKRKIGLLAVAVLCVVTGALLSAPSAQAATPVASAPIAAVDPLTIYHGCPNGVGCVSIDINGGNGQYWITVTNSGYNTCHNLPSNFIDKVSWMSADYGGGWDLTVFENDNCNANLFGGATESQLTSGQRNLNIIPDRANSYIIEQKG
jgi:hypothetical protein